MTPKELLYIEDALGHERAMQQSCTQLAGQLQNADLKNFLTQMASKHGDEFLKFYALLNG